MEAQQVFEGYYLVEQMGHKRIAGFVREQVIAGQGFLRCDVPGEGDEIKATQFIHPNTIYCLTPVEEAVARALAKRINPEPPALLSLQYEAQRNASNGGFEPYQSHEDYEDNNGDDDDDFEEAP